MRLRCSPSSRRQPASQPTSQPASHPTGIKKGQPFTSSKSRKKGERPTLFARRMNDDEDLSLALFLKPSSPPRPSPTKSIYPVQTPYANFSGFTPPPDDADFLFKQCRSPASYPHSLADPPTPPRTEVVSSPARSSRSSASSSPPESESSSRHTSPSSLDGDALMGDAVGYGHGVSPFPLSFFLLFSG